MKSSAAGKFPDECFVKLRWIFQPAMFASRIGVSPSLLFLSSAMEKKGWYNIILKQHGNMSAPM